MNFSIFLISVLLLALFPAYYYSKFFKPKQLQQSAKFQPPEITPIGDDFKWEKQKPYPYRPFKKGTYKMNLAIRKLDPNNLISLEDTYLDRITLREKLFDEEKFFGCHESALDALKETYKTIFSFLTKRYPQYFEITEKNMIHNKITRKFIPLDTDNLTAEEMFRLIACNIEEDVLIMLKNPDTKEYDEYVLRAAVSLFPSGFDPLEKINKPLTLIHGPVPGYVERLQLSMNRFFSRLRPYEYIVRNNWAFQTHPKLCAPTGSHATDEEAKTIHYLYPNDLDFNKCFFRVEKQCFTRLPESGADLMFIRTYVTSLMELRSDLTEEQKEIFCEAVDGLTGRFAVYKKRIEWGEAVKSFIRGESDGSHPTPEPYAFVH